MPENGERRLKWINEIRSQQTLTITRNVLICESHFAPDCLLKINEKTLLKLNAIPTIFDKSSTTPSNNPSTIQLKHSKLEDDEQSSQNFIFELQMKYDIDKQIWDNKMKLLTINIVSSRVILMTSKMNGFSMYMSQIILVHLHISLLTQIGTFFLDVISYNISNEVMLVSYIVGIVVWSVQFVHFKHRHDTANNFVNNIFIRKTYEFLHRKVSGLTYL